ncbi:hypothetical protein M433DRAFT_157966 [Acidomyces richmondensis BFW]|nr:hypothetical protein M433DRAFT_157966 [Acidomyces richmondensis BFW]
MAVTAPKLSSESEGLYDKMLRAAEESPEGLKKVFFQNDLQTLADEAAKTVQQLMVLIQELTNHHLVRAFRLDRALCWSTRSRSAASAIRVLGQQELLVYTAVEESHMKGIWMRELKKKTGLQKECEKSVHKLEAAKLIKAVKNTKYPAQKTFMLFHLVPSDDITGGTFFDDGDLDEGLIDGLSNLIVFHVRQQSWVDAKMRRLKRSESPVETGGTESSTSKKRKRHTNDIEDLTAIGRSNHRSRHHDSDADVIATQLPYQAYTRNYPTTEAIHKFIAESDAIRGAKASQLTVSDIQSIIDVLVWDEKLEKVGDGYRTVRGVKFRHPNSAEDEDDNEIGRNGLTQAPCGRCPVFDLCTEGGPINPGTCVYWQDWIAAGR